MSISSFFAAADQTNDATFRAWGGGMSAALAAIGLALAETNINWLTVTKPALNTYAGYEVWRFNDALQATVPVFFRIRYGTNTNTQWQMYELLVGQSWTAGGNIGGNTSNTWVSGAGTFNAALMYSFASGGTNRVVACWFAGIGTATTQAFGIARTKDVAGADTAAGVNIVIFNTTSGNVQQQFLPAAGAKFPTTPHNNLTGVFGVGAASGNFAGELGVYPVCPWRGYLDYPDLNFLLYITNDMGNNQIVPVYLLGAVHNYYTSGNLGSTTQQGMSLVGVALRYE